MKRNRRIVLSASAGVFQRSVQAASTLVLMPLMLHALGPAQFGVWGAAASLAWLSALLDVGTGSALVTLVARSSASENVDDARRHISGALAFGGALATVVLLAVLLVFIRTGFQGNAGPFLIAVIGLALNIPLSAANNVWMALQKGYVSGFWELVQTLLTLAGLIAAAALTKDVRIYVAVVYAGLVLSNLGGLFHLLAHHPELRPDRLIVPWSAIKEVAGHGMLYFALGVVASLSFMLDNVVALQLLGPEASASMTIALRICMTSAGVFLVISQPFWPAFAEAAHKCDRQWIRKTLFRGTALLVGIASAISLVLLTLGERLLKLWLHTNLGITSGLLWAMSAWIVVQALVRVPSLLLNGLSIIRYQVAVFSFATLLALGLKFVLARHLGVAGILWATSVTTLFIAVPASAWRIFSWARNSAPRQSSAAVSESLAR